MLNMQFYMQNMQLYCLWCQYAKYANLKLYAKYAKYATPISKCKICTTQFADDLARDNIKFKSLLSLTSL